MLTVTIGIMANRKPGDFANDSISRRCDAIFSSLLFEEVGTTTSSKDGKIAFGECVLAAAVEARRLLLILFPTSGRGRGCCRSSFVFCLLRAASSIGCCRCGSSPCSCGFFLTHNISSSSYSFLFLLKIGIAVGYFVACSLSSVRVDGCCCVPRSDMLSSCVCLPL